MKRLPLVFLLLLSMAAAADDFFTSLQDYPAVRSAALSLEAARQEALGAANYVAVDASGGYISRDLAPADPCPLLSDPDPSNDALCQFINPEVPESNGQAEVGITFHAIPYGDVGDYQRTAQINYLIARVDYRSSLASIEKGALEAAMQYFLADEARNLAGEGLQVARDAYQATKLRREKGAASDRDLRQAELALEQAENELQNAEAAFGLAKYALASFTTAAPPAWPWPRLDPPADAEPPAVTKVRLRVEQARIGLEHSQRAFVPVGEIRYQHNLDDNNAVGVSLESRTLGARVYYAYQSYADPTRSRTENELRLGLRLNVTQNDWGGLESARKRLAAAEAGLEAAKKQSELELARLQLDLDQSQRRLNLAKSKASAAKLDYQDARKRADLGISPPLEAERAWLDYAKAELELLQAEQDVVRNQLSILAYLAVPPSEVWK